MNDITIKEANAMAAKILRREVGELDAMIIKCLEANMISEAKALLNDVAALEKVIKYLEGN